LKDLKKGVPGKKQEKKLTNFHKTEILSESEKVTLFKKVELRFQNFIFRDKTQRLL